MPNTALAVAVPPLAVHRSRHLIPPFAFHRPESFAEARALLDTLPDAAVMAGGLDVVNRMKEGRAPAAIVWLGAVPAADEVIRRDGELVAGALLRHDQMAQDAEVRAAFPDLATIWGALANIRVRSQGTIVGNLLAEVPAYEAAILLMAVEARLEGLAPGGAFFDIAATALSDGQGGAVPCPGLVTALRIPLPGPGRMRRLVYDRTLRPALSVALCLDSENGRITRACAVVGGGHARPVMRPLAAEGWTPTDLALRARHMAEGALHDLPAFTTPWTGAADYRGRIAPVLLTRLIEEACR